MLKPGICIASSRSPGCI